MCYRTTCSSCGKPSYGGCGRHVESVLGDVHPENRCACREVSAPAPSAKDWLRSFGRRNSKRPS